MSIHFRTPFEDFSDTPDFSRLPLEHIPTFRYTWVLWRYDGNHQGAEMEAEQGGTAQLEPPARDNGEAGKAVPGEGLDEVRGGGQAIDRSAINYPCCRCGKSVPFDGLISRSRRLIAAGRVRPTRASDIECRICENGRAQRARLAKITHYTYDIHGGFPFAEWHKLLEMTGGICPRCGKQARLIIEHILPVALGGRNNIENLQPLCVPCNLAKRQKTVSYLHRIKGLMKSGIDFRRKVLQSPDQMVLW